MLFAFLSACFQHVLTFSFMSKCVNLWHSCTDATHRSFMLHVWPTGDRVLVQCYPSNTAGIPAKETPDPARHRCKTPHTKRLWDLTACLDWQSAKLEAQPANVIACLFSHSWYLCWHDTAWRRGTWRKLAQQCVITLNLFAWKIHLVWFSSLKKHCSVFFQQRELFKKRWFTLCSVNRKLLYFKTPLVIINMLYLLWNLLWVLIDCLNKKHDRSPMLCFVFFLHSGCYWAWRRLHRLREPQLLCFGENWQECEELPVALRHHAAHTRQAVCVHVWAGPGAEGVAGSLQKSHLSAHDRRRLRKWGTVVEIE